MNGKQSDFSFMANNLSFMANRVPVMVMQAREMTRRAIHSSVTTLCPSEAFTEHIENK